MISDNDLLGYICEDNDMGRSSVRHVFKLTKDETLREVLERQLTDYEKAYEHTSDVLEGRGEKAPASSPFTKLMAYVGTDMKTFSDDSSSKIAEVMIQGNTMGITSLTKQIHEYDSGNRDILEMARNQIKMQQEHIESLKKFL